MILQDCSKIYHDGTTRDLTENDIQVVLNENNKMAGSALRVLGVVFKPHDQEITNPVPATLERDMIFVGLLAMIDPPGPEVKEAVAVCHTAGIKTVMITGDHKNTAQAIGEELGFLSSNSSKAIDGIELDALSDDDLAKEVSKIAVYARVTAEHKLRIVKAWKKQGDVVAMTGDGVNDAPAVKEASIGVAMGITEPMSQKEASDMVITDDNFSFHRGSH